MHKLLRVRSWRFFGLATVAILALGVAGCGGSGEASDEDVEEISSVIADGVTSNDPELNCVELVSESFVTTVYGDEETCRDAEAASDEDDEILPDEVTVSEVEVDGDTASATVTEVGGETDGATGTIDLVREDDAWKVDELGIDYLRSTFDAGLTGGDFTEEEDGPLANAEFRECFGDRLQGMDDESFREFAYQAIADQEPSQEFTELFTECLEDVTDTSGDSGTGDDTGGSADTGGGDSGSGDDVSLLRSQFEQGIRESAVGDDATPKQIDCIVEELRTTISDEEIIEQVARGEKVNPELAGKAAEAILNCG